MNGDQHEIGLGPTYWILPHSSLQLLPNLAIMVNGQKCFPLPQVAACLTLAAQCIICPVSFTNHPKLGHEPLVGLTVSRHLLCFFPGVLCLPKVHSISFDYNSVNCS